MAKRCEALEAGVLEAGVRDGSDGAVRVVEREAGIDAGPKCGTLPAADFSLGGVPISASGTVTAVVAGGVSVCMPDYGIGYGAGFSFLLDDGISISRGAAGLPWNKPLVQTGQKVRIDSEGWTCSNYASYRGTLTIRDDAGALILWISRSTGLGTPPEVAIQAKQHRCSADDGCGVADYRDFDLSIGGAHGTFRGPGRQQIGAYAVAYDGGPLYYNDAHQCTDSYGPDSQLAVVRGNLAALEAPATCGGATCTATEYCDVPAGSACVAADTAGTCKPRPTGSCPTACDPITGCNDSAGSGGFFCNACEAEKLGNSPTDDTACALTGGWVPPAPGPAGTCVATFDCGLRLPVFPPPAPPPPSAPKYSMRCSTGDAGAVECQCLRNDRVLSTMSPASLPACTGASAVSVCNFPSWLLAN